METGLAPLDRPRAPLRRTNTEMAGGARPASGGSAGLGRKLNEFRGDPPETPAERIGGQRGSYRPVVPVLGIAEICGIRAYGRFRAGAAGVPQSPHALDGVRHRCGDGG